MSRSDKVPTEEEELIPEAKNRDTGGEGRGALEGPQKLSVISKILLFD